MRTINWAKMDGLIPAIIQDVETKKIMMLGYFNEESFKQTLISRRVTFFSRSKNRLWIKGETSKNYLNYLSHKVDCDGDAILVLVSLVGPVCHLGTESCFTQNEEE